jgi:hypothetical protein
MKRGNIYAALLVTLLLGGCDAPARKDEPTLIHKLEKALEEATEPSRIRRIERMHSSGRFTESYDAPLLHEVRRDTVYEGAKFYMDDGGYYRKIKLNVYESDSLGVKLSIDGKSGDFTLDNSTSLVYHGNVFKRKVDGAVLGTHNYKRGEDNGYGFENVFLEGDSILETALKRFGIYGDTTGFHNI